MKTKLIKISLLVAILGSGCSSDIVVIDTDNDGYEDDIDGCPFDPLKQAPGTCGCGYVESIDRTTVPYTMTCRDNQLTDNDGDGVPDIFDKCPTDPLKFTPGECGCNQFDYLDTDNQLKCILPLDSDGDGVPDTLDGCPNNRFKVEPGECGCDKLEVLNAATQDCSDPMDSDNDGMPDAFDDCPYNPFVIEIKGNCSCDEVFYDGECVMNDLCPSDEYKLMPGICGCGVLDVDLDKNGIIDCLETACSGNSDTPDSDQDGVPDCADMCPNQPATSHDDIDCDGVMDQDDGCPYNPNRVTQDAQYGCVDYSDTLTEATVYTANDFVEMQNMLTDHSSAPLPRSQTRLTIKIARDLNLADIKATDSEQSFVQWANDGSCYARNADPIIKTLDSVTVTSNDDNVQRKIVFEASDNRGREHRCTLKHALFDEINQSHISNLLLDLEFEGTAVRASLANEVVDSTIENVVFRGTLSTTFCKENMCDPAEEFVDQKSFVPTYPIGGLIGRIQSTLLETGELAGNGSHIINSGCQNVSINAASMPYVGGLAGSIENTEISNPKFEHRIKYINALSSGGVAAIIRNSKFNGFTNTVKWMQLNNEIHASNFYDSGFALSATGVDMSNIKNHIITITNNFLLPSYLAGFVYEFSGKINNIENIIDEFENPDYDCNFTGFIHKTIDETHITNAINRLNHIKEKFEFDYVQHLRPIGFIAQNYTSADSDYKTSITNLFNDVHYEVLANNPSAVFGNMKNENLVLQNVVSAASIDKFDNELREFKPWYLNQLFISDASGMNDVCSSVYYFVPATAPTDEMGITDTVNLENDLSGTCFEHSRISENDVDATIHALNSSTTDANVTWEKTDVTLHGTTYQVPGFKLFE